MTKSRFTKENKQVSVLLTYDQALDRYYGLTDLAEKHGIFKKVSTRLELPDGRKVFAKAINQNPEEYFTPEIMDKLEECAQQEFLYGDYQRSVRDSGDELGSEYSDTEAAE